MKKILIFMLIIVSVVMAFSSCGDRTEENASIIKAEIIDGCLWVTYSNAPDKPVNLGVVEEQNDSGLDFYPLPDGTYGVMVGNSKYLEKIVIPDKFNGKAVTRILPEAFSSATNLKEITIPNSVTSIGDRAFYDCTGLTSIEISDSVTSIGRSAFYNCTGLTSIEIPDGVTSIGQSAFYGCTGLTSMEIPDNVTSIGDSAFSLCTGLTSIKFAESSKLTSIGKYAFAGCTGLTSITIPNSVTSIGKWAFDVCTGLTSATFENTNGWKIDNESIPSDVLKDPATAAEYLTEIYRYRVWTRS